jgi:hypothetical protein
MFRSSADQHQGAFWSWLKSLVKTWVFKCGYAAAYVHSFYMLCCVEMHADCFPCSLEGVWYHKPSNLHGKQHMLLHTRQSAIQNNKYQSWSCSKAVYKPVWHIPLLSVQWINSWRWTDELSETCRVSCQNKFVKLVHLVGFTIKKLLWSTVTRT